MAAEAAVAVVAHHVSPHAEAVVEAWCRVASGSGRRTAGLQRWVWTIRLHTNLAAGCPFFRARFG